MSVIIKSLDLPSNCGKCCFSQWSYYHQTACCKLNDYEPVADDFSKDYIQKRADFCPIEPWPEPKTGKWVTVHGYCTPGGDPVWACSECGKGLHVYGVEHGSYGRDVSDGQWKACPNCGAKMEGEEHV